ncbi:MAG: flagellar biosynthesis protein FlgH [Opitutia bacterium Tous-C1TDCM]|nr:MAG: flagellar biosynthesis protein FlgH [Opitutae bacterium Tous-C1TDCM]
MKTVFKSAFDSSRRASPRIAASVYAIFFAAFAALLLLVSSSRAESLWNAAGVSGRSMFADRKAAGRGDILTIVVSESAVAQSSQNKKSTRESTLQDALTKFIYPGLGTHKGQLPGMGATGATSYSGGGDVSNSQSLSARAAVLVTDVLPNGNLVIEGVRVVTFSGETQYVVLRGLVRPDDIARDNSVVSTNIADARVEFYAEGALTDAQKRGWLTKVYEKLRPL